MTSNKENHAEQVVREMLKGAGLDPRRVPHARNPTADFLVDNKYLVEVRKYEDDFSRELRERARHTGGASGARPLVPTGAIRGLLHRKAKQLRETPANSVFRVLWIVALHPGGESIAQLIEKELYGIATW